ncbi:MAG: Fic family protein [Chloroflexi bacterium]|nr:Fic family protein [Chloroflexota bacterium]
MLFQTPDQTDDERAVIARIDDLRRSLRFQVSGHPARWSGSLRRAMFARAIQGSNTIEGYTVDLADAMALAEGEEPLAAAEETQQAIAGYRDAMTYVLQLSDDPHFTYSDGLIRSLHFMLLKHDMSKGPGLWRPGPVYVRHEPSNQAVYEGPPSAAVPGLMGELVADLGDTDGAPALVRAAMAHLNFVMIHPFRDGNGRMARILQSLVLAREGILAPEFASIEEYLGRRTEEYYAVLADVGARHWQPERSARAWVRFCLTAHFRQARTLARRVAQAERLWTALEDEARRRGLPERTVYALFDAAQRFRVRNAGYMAHADLSEYAGGRDLKRLVEVGLLEPRGEKRGRYYVASPALAAVAARTRQDGRAAELEDPFAPEQQELAL